jgi:hypothetical protein
MGPRVPLSVLCKVRGVINYWIAIASARGILMAQNCSFLCDYGGNLNPDKAWTKSLLKPMGFVKRCTSTTVRLPGSDFEHIKDFLERIKTSSKYMLHS